VVKIVRTKLPMTRARIERDSCRNERLALQSAGADHPPRVFLFSYTCLNMGIKFETEQAKSSYSPSVRPAPKRTGACCDNRLSRKLGGDYGAQERYVTPSLVLIQSGRKLGRSEDDSGCLGTPIQKCARRGSHERGLAL
jgi:hypothetical protein